MLALTTSKTIISCILVAILLGIVSTITYMPMLSVGAKLIRKIKVIIWDEAPIVKHQSIEIVERSFRDIMGVIELFGVKFNNF